MADADKRGSRVAGCPGGTGAREYDWDDLVGRLLTELQQSSRQVVERVRRTMPEAYFRDTDPQTLLGHLKAIIAAEATGLPQEIRLRSEDGTRVTFVHERNYPGQLAELVRQLPQDRPLLAAKVHTADDGGLVLDVFELGQLEPVRVATADRQQALAGLLAYAGRHATGLAPAELERHLAGCDPSYPLKVPERRMCEHVRLLREVRQTENTAVAMGPRKDAPLSDLRVGMGRVDAREMFQRIARYLGHRRVDIRRAYVNSFDIDSDQPLTLTSLLVSGENGAALDPASAAWHGIERDLRRLQWLDEPTLELAYRCAGWSLDDADALMTVCRLAHQVIVRREGPTVAHQRVLEACERHLAVARGLVDGLQCGAEAADRELRKLARQIDNTVDNEETRRILHTVLEVVRGCSGTNLGRPERCALAMSVAPGLLGLPDEETPHGVLFVRGRDFDGFHVRFRAIARGGLRIVRPRSWEQHTLENERLYAEAYGLAFAQQLKNKDIPEGGSKGVLLLAPGADPEAAGRAYADALLDLTLGNGEAPHGELLYLGPDENVTDRLISWIVDRAEHRGHPNPNAFMSSKPGVGINHKQYGVTSEGVTVFLEVALGHLGIDPRRQDFTIKMTGGPDGDVAGNQIRILHREYGPRARWVGIADGSGCAEDPAGLDHDELRRLVDAGLPIAEFDRARLGPGGSLCSVEEPGGARARNTLHNRVVSDAFVPAGGRPRTVHEGNWHEFLREDGTPSSRVIVEGANLFLTPGARQQLSEHGVVLVKDSSANKCGVICSSFEILASMVWTEQRFLELKPRFVADVIDKLRELARLEAELLFDEHRHRPGVGLPELSTRLSRTIIRAADAITSGIREPGVAGEDLVRYLAAQHFPAVLVEDAGEKLFTCLPPGYIESAVATVLASRIVYREGLSYLEEMPPAEIAELSLGYLRADVAVSQLARQLDGSDLPDRERIARLLREGGARAALRRRIPDD